MEHPYIKSNRANVVKPVGREESRGGVFKAQSKSKNEAAAKPAKRHSFCNWAGNQRSNSAQIFHPNTANDLVEIIMDKIFKPVHVEGNVWNVEIETGVTVKDLDDYLRKHNPPLAMACNVDVECIRYGGIISMGSHGATTRTRSLKDLVDTIKIIDASGIMATFSKENDPVEFSAAALNLGLFGIIYARCVSRPCQVADVQPGRCTLQEDGGPVGVVDQHIVLSASGVEVGRHYIDLFATAANAKVPRFISWKQEEDAWSQDAFNSCWSDMNRVYACPPWSLINKVLKKIKQDKVKATVITPFWTSVTGLQINFSLVLVLPVTPCQYLPRSAAIIASELWYPTITAMSVDKPLRIPRSQVLPAPGNKPLIIEKNPMWSLSAWSVDGNKH
ncbi:hypothetical protein F5H01DRAFT_372746 [Linnemannia elongata]|nr:hypothetical protein F5H01DRAFT_372746 [Linnemannia elongata]